MAGREPKWREEQGRTNKTKEVFGGTHQQLHFDGVSGRGEAKAVIATPRTFVDITRISSVDEMQTPLGLKMCD